MPLRAIYCCGRDYSIEEWYAHLATRSECRQWTYELGRAMVSSSVAHPSNDDPTRISTTVLTSKCLRQVALERFNDYELEPSSLYAAFRGTQFHGQMEAHASPGSYAEARFFVEDLGTLIPVVKKALPRKDRSFSGSPDLVDPTVGVLFDYKRTKEVPRFDSVWGDHVEQLNVNRWLVDHAETVGIKGYENDPRLPPPLEVLDNGTCVFDLTRPDVRSFFVPMDWQELVIVYVDDKGPKPLTVMESIDVPKVGGVGTKKARVPALWSDEKCEAFIAERYIAARNALTSKSAPIPKGWERQGHILCGYCPVRDLCADQERADEATSAA
jgi:hypothetical protein